MIPKIIHYCWFGGKPLPKSAQKCIASWKKFFPDYQIKEWNESNYNVRKVPYTEQAYDAKKYAFVSDYARFDILYQEGGIYFDTDVEVIKSFEDILENGPFMGCEIDGIWVNPGLGMAAEAGMLLYQEILQFYSTQSFYKEDGTINAETVVEKTTNILKEHGFSDTGNICEIAGITIYPQEYFNPKDSRTGKVEITKNTHSIHWYSMTWISPMKRVRKKLLTPFHRIFGPKCFAGIKKVIHR